MHESRELFSLVFNSKERLEATEILKEKGKIATSMECAYLGVEIALKAVLVKHGKTFPRTHDLAKVLSSFSAEMLGLESYKPVLDRLYLHIAQMEENSRFWTPSSRYERTQFTAQEQNFAATLAKLGRTIVKWAEQKQ